jgi:hypothetical protein
LVFFFLAFACVCDDGIVGGKEKERREHIRANIELEKHKQKDSRELLGAELEIYAALCEFIQMQNVLIPLMPASGSM